MVNLNALMYASCFWLVQIQVNVTCAPVLMESLSNEQGLSLKRSEPSILPAYAMPMFVKRGKHLDRIKGLFGGGKRKFATLPQKSLGHSPSIHDGHLDRIPGSIYAQ